MSSNLSDERIDKIANRYHGATVESMRAFARAILTEGSAAPDQVQLPTNRAQAETMVRAGVMWLDQHPIQGASHD